MSGAAAMAVAVAMATATATAMAVIPAPPAAPRVTAARIELTAAPPGAIPLAFLRNQVTFCGLICPFIAQGVVTVPAGVLTAPLSFVETLRQSGNVLKALGAAGSAVTAVGSHRGPRSARGRRRGIRQRRVGRCVPGR